MKTHLCHPTTRLNKPLLKKIWGLTWPVILSNSTIPLLGMVDIAVVGHNYPAEILSTVAIGTTVFDVLFGLFIFLRMSTTGLTAQNPKKPVILQRALITALMISALIIVLSPSLFRLICVLVPMNVNIKEGLFSYFHLRILATPAILINFVLMGYFFGQQNTKAPLMMLLLINLSAIVLDFVLVNYFRIGLKGLGYANILSQCFGSALGVILTHHQYKPFVKQNGELFEPSALMAFFHLNKDIFIRTLCLMISIATFTRLGAGLGPSVVAANLILMSLHQFSSYFLDGFAISCEALVGKALGRNDVKEFIAALKACFLYSILIGCALSLIYSLLGSQIISLLSSIQPVVQIANANLMWLSLLPLVSVISFLLDGVFIGATWSKPMRNTMLLATFAVFLPLCWLLKSYGNSGLWFSFISFIAARGVFLSLSLYQRLSKPLK